MDVNAQISQAAALTNEGRWAEAAGLFAQVIDDPQASNDTKAFMCHNIAICHEKLGNAEGAFTSHQTGSRWALSTYIQVQFERANMLSRHGRASAAARLMEKLNAIEDLRPDDREVIEKQRSGYLDLAAGKTPKPAPPAASTAGEKQRSDRPRFREVPHEPLG